MKTTMQFTITLNAEECTTLRDALNSLLSMRVVLNDHTDLSSAESVLQFRRQIDGYELSDAGLSLLQAIYIDLP